MSTTFDVVVVGSDLPTAIVTTREHARWTPDVSRDEKAFVSKIEAAPRKIQIEERPAGVTAQAFCDWLTGVSEPPARYAESIGRLRRRALRPDGPVIIIESAYTEATAEARRRELVTRPRRPHVYHCVGTAVR